MAHAMKEMSEPSANLQERAQIASQMNWLLVWANAGGMAAILAWIQTLPLDTDPYTCNSVLLQVLPFAAKFMLAGLLTCAIAYVLRYWGTLHEGQSAVGWMLALAVSASCFFVSIIWTADKVTDCKSIAAQARLNARYTEFFGELNTASGGRQKDLRDSFVRRVTNADFAHYIGGELHALRSTLNEFLAMEQALFTARELHNEFSRLGSDYHLDEAPYLQESLNRADGIEQALLSRMSVLAQSNQSDRSLLPDVTVVRGRPL